MLHWLVLPLLVMLALLLGGGRLVMGSLDQFRPQLERLLSAQLPYELHIGRLHGGWRYFSPRLQVDDLWLQRGGQEALRLQRLELELDLPASLLQGTPVARRIWLDGLQLTLSRNDAGGWQLAGGGVPGDRAAPALLSLLQPLWVQPDVIVRELQLRLLQPGAAAPLAPLALELAWQNRDGQQHLTAELDLGAGDRVSVQAEAQGLPGSDQFHARYYLRTALSSARSLGPWLPAGQTLPDRLELAAELWGEWQGRDRQQLVAQLSLPTLQWQGGAAAPGQQSFDLEQFRTQLQWQQREGQWQAGLSGVAGSLDGQPLSIGQLLLTGQGATLQRVNVPELSLAPLWTRLMDSELLAAELRERLRPLAPRGVLRNLNLLLDLPASDAGPGPLFRLDADMDKVAVNAWQGAPEASGISGRIRFSDRQGQVDLDSERLWLNFPMLYSQGWQFEHAKGVVSWQRDAAEVRVESQLLSLAGQDLKGNGRFLIEIPTPAYPEREGRLILMIGMQDSDAAQAPLFVPDRILNPALFHWLQGALHEGRLRYGGLVYDAPLRVPEGADPRRSTQLFFDTTATSVRYQPDWPAIHDADAFTLIRGSEVLVQIPSGLLYEQTRIGQAEVYLPPDSHRLEVRARMDGPAADGRLALLESPIGTWLGEEFARWHLSGAQHTELNLAIDLDAVAHPRIRVDSQLRDAEYWSEALNLRISAIDGDVHYDDRRGLYADQLSGRLFDQPLVVQIHTGVDADKTSTRIGGHGRVALAALREWSGLPLLDALSGETGYDFDLRICGYEPGCSGLTVESDLLGVTVSAPAPFAKSADQPMPLRVQLALTPGEQWLSLHTAGLESRLALRAGELLGGEVAFGERSEPLPQRTDGIRISGKLAEVDLTQWRSFVEQHFLGGQSLTALAPGTSRSPLREVALEAGTLAYQGYRFSGVRTLLQQQPEHWLLELHSAEAEGSARIATAADQPHQITLERLYLPAAEGASAGSADALAELDPRILPRASIQIADLRQGDKAYGSWQVEVTPSDGGAHVEPLTGNLHGMAVDGRLDWHFDGNQHSTALQLQANAADLGDVMVGMGSARSLQTEAAAFVGQLSWRGSPAGFDWASLSGQTELHAERGRILDAGDRPVLKLFSLLNINTLLRRLSLDFADLSNAGTFFDAVDAQLELNDGVAQTTRTATLLSPTHDIEWDGRIDLAAEQLDLEMLVKLPVTENLPIAAALLASPAVAGAVFLVERLIGKTLKRFTSVRYRLSGPWDDPTMEPMRSPPTSDDRPGRLPDSDH